MKKIVITLSLILGLVVTGLILVSCTPEPKVETYNLNVTNQNPDLGTISGTPNGTYDEGTTISVSADPNAGASFTGWYQDGVLIVTAEDYSFPIDQDTNLVAHFAVLPVYYSYSVSSQSTDRGTVAGTASGSYLKGSALRAIANAKSGAYFTGWYQANQLVSSSSTYDFTLEADTTLVAHFELEIIHYTLLISSENSLYGSVSGSPSGQYDENTTLTVVATAVDGASFDGWYSGTTLVSSDSPYVFDLVGNITLVAKFSQIATDTVEINGAPEWALVGDSFTVGVTITPSNSWLAYHPANLVVTPSASATLGSDGLVTISAATTVNISYVLNDSTVLASQNIIVLPDLSTLGTNFTITSGTKTWVAAEGFYKEITSGVETLAYIRNVQDLYWRVTKDNLGAPVGVTWHVSMDASVAYNTISTNTLFSSSEGIVYSANVITLYSSNPDSLLAKLAQFSSALTGVPVAYAYWDNGVLNISDGNSTVVTISGFGESVDERLSRLYESGSTNVPQTAWIATWAEIGSVYAASIDSVIFDLIPNESQYHLFKSPFFSSEEYYNILEATLVDIDYSQYVAYLNGLQIPLVGGRYNVSVDPGLKLLVANLSGTLIGLYIEKPLDKVWPEAQIISLINNNLGVTVGVNAPAFEGGDAYIAKYVSDFNQYVQIRVLFLNSQPSAASAAPYLQAYYDNLLAAGWHYVATTDGINLVNAANNLRVTVSYSDWSYYFEINIYKVTTITPLPSSWPTASLVSNLGASVADVPQIAGIGFNYFWSSFDNYATVRVYAVGITTQSYINILNANGYLVIFHNPRMWDGSGTSYVNGTWQITVSNNGTNIIDILIYAEVDPLPAFSSSWPAEVNVFSPVAIVPELVYPTAQFAVVKNTASVLQIYIIGLSGYNAAVYALTLAMAGWQVDINSLVATHPSDPGVVLSLALLANDGALVTINKTTFNTTWDSFLVAIGARYNYAFTSVIFPSIGTFTGISWDPAQSTGANKTTITITGVDQATYENWFALLAATTGWQVFNGGTQYDYRLTGMWPSISDIVYNAQTQTLVFSFRVW